jgi:quinol monooxygenase YgiN
MNDSLTVIAHVRAKPGQESRVRQLLEGLLAPTRAEAGCINYDLHQSQTDPALFVKHTWMRMPDPRTFNPFENWRTRPLLSPYKSPSGKL